MQLERLQMRNFKRYRSADVKFGDGITGIVGNNGTGKSTLVDAILFCLYGVKETGLDPGHIRTASAGPGDRAEVRLDFSVRGEKYQLLRTLGPGKRHETQFNQGGKLLAKGVSEVREALWRVIRMDHADFRRTIFSSQKELLILVGATAGERREWFRKVLGIDALRNKGGEMIRAEVQAAHDRLLAIEGRLAGASREELGRQRRQAELGMVATDREMVVLEGERSSLGRRKEALEAERRALQDREKLDFSTRNEIGRHEQEAAEICRDLERTRAGIAAFERDRREFEELAARKGNYESLRTGFAASSEKLQAFRSLAEKEEEKQARIREIGAELRELGEEEARLGRDEERMQALAPSRVRSETARSRLECLRGLAERSRAILGEIAAKEAAIAELARRGGALQTRLGRIREARARLEDLAKQAGVVAGPGKDPLRLLEERRLGLLGAVADGNAAIEHARVTLEKTGTSLATLEAEGPGGACPTCRQPLGERQQDLVAGMRDELKDLEMEISSREGELAHNRDAIAALNTVLEEARDLAGVAAHIGEVTGEWEEVQERTLAEISRKERLEEDLARLGYDPGEQRSLERELESLEGPVRELAIIADRLKGRETLTRKIRDQEGKLRRLEEECSAIARQRSDLGFDPMSHLRLEEEYRKMDRGHRRYLELRPGMDRLPVLEGQAAGLEERAGRVKASLTGLKATLESIAFRSSDLEGVRGDLLSQEQRLLEIAGRIEGFRSERSHLEAERDRLTTALERLDREKEEHDRLSDEIQLLELTRGELNGFTDHLLGVVRGQIQEETGRILSEITDGRYDTVILDDAFELLVHDLGGDYPVARFSGGEQDDVAIALRIALSRYIAETHELHDSTFLIFDEIFGSQDEERRGNIFRALRALEPFFPQIFLISHVTEVQGEFGNTLVVEAISGTESRVRGLEGAGT